MILKNKKKYNYTIIGGGISGLATLHSLMEKHKGQPNVKIRLLEKAPTLGGTIKTVQIGGCLIETGPNGFLDSKPRTLEFLNELGLTDQIICADESAKIRYICDQYQLSPLPTKPKEFFHFPLLTFSQKIRVLFEFFVGRGRFLNETVYDFGCRRLGARFTELFLDSMVSGIFAGDSKDLVLREAFPRIHQLERTYGSLFLAMLQIGRKRRKALGRKRTKASPVGSPTGSLKSLQKGMGQVIEKLALNYSDKIQTGCEVISITQNDQKIYQIQTRTEVIESDKVILCVPAHVAGQITTELSSNLSESLKKVPYSPVAVVGMIFDQKVKEKLPKGFGYLIPGNNNREVLGVLFDSQVYPSRAPENKTLIRLMIGGARHPKVTCLSMDELQQLAKDELRHVLGIKDVPVEFYCHLWEDAIPQYNLAYLEAKQEILKELETLSGLEIVSNYIGGISFNDCVHNAHQTVEKISNDPESKE